MDVTTRQGVSEEELAFKPRPNSSTTWRRPPVTSLVMKGSPVRVRASAFPLQRIPPGARPLRYQLK
jgi:hypothetical protein